MHRYLNVLGSFLGKMEKITGDQNNKLEVIRLIVTVTEGS